jgi:4-aminobutyrate aminotransferase
VQSGIGRTGKMFAAEHWGVRPDIMTLAKGLGSGLPIGLVVARRPSWRSEKRGAHGNTCGGNPICCAAALRRSIWCSVEYAANAAQSAPTSSARLRDLQKEFECIGDVRGRGLMIGAELITDRASHATAAALCQRC